MKSYRMLLNTWRVTPLYWTYALRNIRVESEPSTRSDISVVSNAADATSIVSRLWR